MSATVRSVHAHCSVLDEDTVREHLARVDADYLAGFDSVQIAAHVTAMSSLSTDRPVQVLCQDLGEDKAGCTVVAFDHNFEFSLIAGVLASTGFRIDRGDVFTLRPLPTSKPQIDRRRRVARPIQDPRRRRVIIDWLCGDLTEAEGDFGSWSQVSGPALEEVLGLLNRGDKDSVERSKHRVN